MESRLRRLVVMPALAGLVVALAAGLVWIRTDIAEARTAQEEREAALRAAGVHAVSRLSLHHRTVDDDIRRALSTSTGEARSELAAEAAKLKQAAIDTRAIQTGVVRAAGLVSMNAELTSADVLVVADALLRWEGGRPAPQDRYYRWRMRVSKVGGAWLVSKAEQVS
jgi:hypothetical protein